MDVTDEQWKERLTPEQYRILREKQTETLNSGALLHNEEAGTYACAACGNVLFDSHAKFDSGSGWPSFYQAIPGSVNFNEDASVGMVRTEITCSRCGSHLGHLFADAPDQPSGQRYCVNSLALSFTPKKES